MLVIGIVCARAKGAKLSVQIGFKIAVNGDIEVSVFLALSIKFRSL